MRWMPFIDRSRVCAISITRVIATYAIAQEYVKHPNDVICTTTCRYQCEANSHADYTAPVFFWTNIELSLVIVCACLPTLRPIYLSFFPKTNTTSSSGYGYESSRPNGVTKKTSLGPKFNHTPYEEIEEIELTGQGGRWESVVPEGAILVLRELSVHETTKVSGDSSTESLRGKASGT